jgi:hypothetical protein
MRGGEKSGKGETNKSWVAGPAVRYRKNLVRKGMIWGRMRPSRVEKQLKQTSIVYGDNFQEF